MIKMFFFFIPIAFLSYTVASAQISSTDSEFEGQPIGGKEQMDYVLQTQLSLPKTLLTSHFDAGVTAYFNLDSAGRAEHVDVEGALNNALRNEIKRMFRFLKFRRTLDLPDEPRPYYLKFSLSTEKYNRYYKQKSKFSLKKPLPADSSYVIYSRADRSPEYYKNGETGLEEFILSEIEYPKIATERSIQGTVLIEFVVETNGFVTNITVKQGVNGGCSEEALRLMKQTKWQPAVLNNKLVRYRTSYPITFSLSNQNKTETSTSPTGIQQ